MKPRRPNLFRCCVITLITLLGIMSCGGSSSSDPASPVTDPTNPPINPGPGDPNADSGLTHTGTQIANGTGASLTGPLFSTIGRDQALALSQDLGVIFEVVENHGGDANENCTAIGAEWGSCSVVNIHLKDTSGSLSNPDWKLYFHSIRRVLRVDSDEFNVVHINGDLNYLTPSAGYTGFTTDTVKTIKLVTEFSHLHESDIMPRYWLVQEGQPTVTLANTDTDTEIPNYAVEITGDNRKAFNGEPNPIADSVNRFDKYASTQTLTSVDSLIIPTPKNIVEGSGSLNLGGGLAIDDNVLSAASTAAINARLTQFNNAAGTATPVTTSISSQLGPDEYSLIVDNSGISISGHDAQAVFYGAQSVLALITPGSNSIPFVNITDAPRYDYRGMHLDVARNFQSVASVKKLIDQLAAYKMNKLHLHLTDDEGWRLEIPGLPELTTVGASRQFQLNAEGLPTESSALLPQLGSGPNNGNQGPEFFSRAQFVDLITYAKNRYVDVIPEFDMPGHARAAVVAMRARADSLGMPGNTNIRLDDPADTSVYLTVQHYDDGIINPCVEGTYNFLSTLVTEVNAMYTDAGSTLNIWHMGGDEAKSVLKGFGFPEQSGDYPWEQSPVCQALIASTASLSNLDDLTPYFIGRLSQIVNNAGIESLYAYQDILRNVQPSQIATNKAGVGFWEVVWSGGSNTAYDWPNRGYETVIAVPDYLYFDFPQEVDPKERGYYWATRFTDTQKVFSFAPDNLPQNAETSVNRDGSPFSATGTASAAGFKGMQGQLWSETVRTAEHMDYMVYPRLLALAERAWHTADWELAYSAGTQFSGTTNLVNKTALATDWSRFANALGKKELAKLDAAGVLYRIPTAGAKSVGGTLSMNTEFPGLTIEYSTDGTSWQSYNPTARPSTALLVRTRSANGALAGRATPVE